MSADVYSSLLSTGSKVLIIRCVSLPFPASAVRWLILAIRKDFSAGPAFESSSRAFHLTASLPDLTRLAENAAFSFGGNRSHCFLVVCVFFSGRKAKAAF